MEIRELAEQDIIENLEQYNKRQQKVRVQTRVKIILFWIGLIVLYLYLRLFNTKFNIDMEEGTIEIKYSTAWIINCPSFLSDFEDTKERIVFRDGLAKCPYVSVLNFEEGITHIVFCGVSESARRDLHTVSFPSTMKYVSGFEDCTTLGNVIWESAAENTVISEDAFKNTGIEEICIPEGVVEIEACAFAKNEKLTTVTLPNSLKEVEYGIFQNCMELQEVTWSDSLNEIPSKTFLGCEKLTSLQNTDSIRSITYNALSGTQITSNQLPENVFCYSYYYLEPMLNEDENIWFQDYAYTYDAEEEVQYLAQLHNLPIEIFEIDTNSGSFWLNGKYYNLDMTLEEFMANDNWEISFTSENEDDNSNYVLDCKEKDCEVRLVVKGETEILEYNFPGEDGDGFSQEGCKVVLPDGVNNFGMSRCRLPFLYGEESTSNYTLLYHDGNKQAEVEVYFDKASAMKCDISITR